MPTLQSWQTRGLPLVVPGQSLAVNDLLELFSNGRVYKCSVSDYASVPNGGTVIAGPTSYTQAACSNDRGMPTLAQDSQGNLFAVTTNSTLNGINLVKFNVLGVQIASVVINSNANVCNDVGVAVLSGGNVVVTYFDSASSNRQYYLVFSNVLAVVKASVNMGTNNAFAYSLIPLSGGGFAISHSASGLLIYDSSGNQLFNNATGGFIIELSNGNIASVIVSTNYTVNVFNTSAVLQAGPLNLAVAGNFGTGAQNAVYLSKVSGFFAVATVASAAVSQNCWVISNAAVLQGANNTRTINGSLTTIRNIFNDGANFWLVTDNSTAYVPTYTKITTAGVATTYGSSPPFTAGYNAWSSACDVAGQILTIATAPGTGSQYTVFDTVSGLCTTPPATLNTSYQFSNSTGGLIPFAASLGDSAFGINGAGTSTTTTGFVTVLKGASSSILGTALAVGTLGGGSIVCDASPGYKAINAVAGTPGKRFNMASDGATIAGNAGTMVALGVELRGLS